MRLWLVTLRTQLWWGFRRSLLSRRALIPLLGFLPLWAMEVVVLVRRQNPHFLGRFFIYFNSWAYLSILLPLVALFLAVSALQDDREGGSLVYLVSRPAPRPAVPLGRAAGAGLASILFALVFLGGSLLLFAVWGRFGRGEKIVGPETVRAFLAASVMGALCFTALGTFFGAFFKKGLLVGMALVLGWELAAGSFLSQAQVTTGLRSLLATDLSRQTALVLLPETLRLEVSRGLPLPPGTELTGLLWGAAQYLLVFLVLAVLAFSLKEHPYRAREN